MKAKFNIDGLKCANCAAKIEENIKNLDGVTDARVSYMTEKVKLEVEDGADIDAIIDSANEIADRIEPGAVIRK